MSSRNLTRWVQCRYCGTPMKPDMRHRRGKQPLYFTCLSPKCGRRQPFERWMGEPLAAASGPAPAVVAAPSPAPTGGGPAAVRELAPRVQAPAAPVQPRNSDSFGADARNATETPDRAPAARVAARPRRVIDVLTGRGARA